MAFRGYSGPRSTGEAVSGIIDFAVSRIRPVDSSKMKNSFDQGPESWHSYEYTASKACRTNIFILATWEKNGGVHDSGHIWCDESRWSIDTPEEPHSILPLLNYPAWYGCQPPDMREAEVRVYLRGDGLELHGAKCCFWVLSADPQARFHFTSQPLEIGDGAWPAEPSLITLKNDPSAWHLSWAANPASPPLLDTALGHCQSYGFSFLGFSREVTGRLSMDEFEIKLKG